MSAGLRLCVASRLPFDDGTRLIDGSRLVRRVAIAPLPGLGHVIHSPARPRIAAGKSPGREQESLKHTMRLNSFKGVARAARVVAARRGQGRRDPTPVSVNRCQHHASPQAHERRPTSCGASTETWAAAAAAAEALSAAWASPAALRAIADSPCCRSTAAGSALAYSAPTATLR